MNDYWGSICTRSLILQFVEWPILDPLPSIGFTAFILVNVVRNLWITGKLFFQAVPDRQLRRTIESRLPLIPGIAAVHHLHLWSLDGEHHVLTAHVVLKASDDIHHPQLKAAIAKALDEYPLEHTTIEVEHSEEFCRDGAAVSK